MEFVFQSLKKFDRKTGTIAEWIENYETRCTLAGVTEDLSKIQLCTLFIGQAGADILTALPTGTTWDEAKQALISRISFGSQEEEAWAALKALKRNGKDLADLGSEAEKWAKLAYPDSPAARARHAIEAFLGALDPALSVKIQEQGHNTLESVLSAARRLERLQAFTSTPSNDSVITFLQEELRAMRKQLEEVERKKVKHIQALEDEAAHAVQSRPRDPAFLQVQYPPRAPMQYPPVPPPPRPTLGRPIRRCFCCNEEGHFIAQCPLRYEFQEYQRYRRGGPPHPPEIPPLLALEPPKPGPSLN